MTKKEPVHVCDKEEDIATIKADVRHIKGSVESLTKNLIGEDGKGGAIAQIQVNKSNILRLWLCLCGVAAVVIGILSQLGMA